MSAPFEEPLAGRLAVLREGWLAGHRAVEITAATGIPLGLVARCAIVVLGLPQRPPPDAARSRALLDAWRWFLWWRRQWHHRRRSRRRPRRPE